MSTTSSIRGISTSNSEAIFILTLVICLIQLWSFHLSLSIIVVVHRSSFSHHLCCLSLLFLKEYVGRSSRGGRALDYGGWWGRFIDRKAVLTFTPLPDTSMPGDAYEQAHHVRTGIGESWWWKRPWTPPAMAKSSPFFDQTYEKV